jgi:hypothetical protein
MEWSVTKYVCVFTMKACGAVEAELYLLFRFALYGNTLYSWGKLPSESTE